MQSHINLVEEWQANMKVVVRNISMLNTRVDGKAIHELRVAIKKLRAYAKLLIELEGDASDKNVLPKTEQLFKILGKHREWQIVLEKLKKPSEDGRKHPIFERHISRETKQMGSLVKDELKAYNVNELTEIEQQLITVVEAMSEIELFEKVRDIISEHVNKLNRLVKDFKQNVHEVRKLLKTILYWIKLFPEGSLCTAVQLQAIDDCLDKLGKWHDLQVAFQRTKVYRKNYLPGTLQEYEDLKETEGDIKNKRNKLFDKLKPESIVYTLKRLG